MLIDKSINQPETSNPVRGNDRYSIIKPSIFLEAVPQDKSVVGFVN